MIFGAGDAQADAEDDDEVAEDDDNDVDTTELFLCCAEKDTKCGSAHCYPDSHEIFSVPDNCAPCSQ